MNASLSTKKKKKKKMISSLSRSLDLSSLEYSLVLHTPSLYLQLPPSIVMIRSLL